MTEFGNMLEELKEVELREEQRLRATALSISVQTFHLWQGYPTSTVYTQRDPSFVNFTMEDAYRRAEEIMDWIKNDKEAMEVREAIPDFLGSDAR